MCILTEVIVVIYEGSVFWGDHRPKTEAGLSFSTSYHDFSLSAGIPHLFRYVVQFSTRTFNIYVLVIVKSLSIYPNTRRSLGLFLLILSSLLIMSHISLYYNLILCVLQLDIMLDSICKKMDEENNIHSRKGHGCFPDTLLVPKAESI